MFESIKKVCRNMTKMDADNVLREVFKKDPDLLTDIANLNKDQMFEDGTDALGQELGEYHPITIAEKIKKGQRHDHITLNDTGEFYDSIKVKSESEDIVITADMKKPDTDLEQRYPDALGLTDENLEKINGLVQPIFIETVRQRLFT